LTLHPSPENETVYRPVSPDDPDIIALAKSIRQHGIQEPLVITEDGYIVSGHRRFVGAELAGLDEVPCRIVAIRRDTDHDEFVRLLAEYNRQRVKTRDEQLREECLTINPEEAYTALLDYREDQSQAKVQGLDLGSRKQRKQLTSAKMPLLQAIWRILQERKKFLPLTDRQIHYGLLNDPPLIHASKPDSRYRNNKKSYNATVDVLTRARVAGIIDYACIADPTRPVTIWDVNHNVGAFIRSELDGFLKGYWRDLQQSQPAHIEMVVEKNTVEPIISKVAMQYCIPLTSGRGYCSLPPRRAMAERFRSSGKDRMVIVILSDFDPEGLSIALTLPQSLRDDFKIPEDQITAVRAALTVEQVREYDLPTNWDAKKSSPRYKKFAAQYGDAVYELEALPPEVLQELTVKAVESVMDRTALNVEIESEAADAAYLEGVRRQVKAALSGLVE
jgi:hypothetical protein